MHATKQHILTTGRPVSQAAFDLLRKTKCRWVGKGFALQAAARQDNDPSKGLTEAPQRLHFCVITSKKTYKRAVDRNRLRRRLNAVALEILPLHASLSMDYMVVGRTSGLDMPFDDLKKEMLWCLKKLDLQKTT